MIDEGVLRKLSIVMFFVFGACVPILNSVILKDSYPWKNGLTLRFRKPWFQLTTQFFGMSLFVIPSILYKRLKKREPNLRFIHVDGGWNEFRKVALPALCNILATGLQNKALMYIPTAVWQVFFGFQVLFATLFAVTYRRQKLLLVDWLGLFISVAGMSFSGVGALLRGISTGSDQSISGIFFSFIIAIISHGIQAFQTIIEEKLLHDEGINTATLTAYEGVWGLYVCVFIILPFVATMSPTDSLEFYENTIETFEMLGNSARLVSMVVVFLICVTLYSFFGLAVTELSSAIHRNMYEMVRPLPVWALSFVTYYITDDTALGEPIDSNTILELGGFCVSVIGSLIYNRVIKFPCFVYIEEEKSIHGGTERPELEYEENMDAIPAGQYTNGVVKRMPKKEFF